MKDLYRRIGLASQTNDLFKVEQAMKSTIPSNLDDAEAAKYILLNPRRKKAYDRNREEIARIGQLRARMDLLNAPNWRSSGVFSDFAPARNNTVANAEPIAETEGYGYVLGIIVLIVALIIILLLVISYTDKKNHAAFIRAAKEFDRQGQSREDRREQKIENTKREQGEKGAIEQARLDRLKEFVIHRYQKNGLNPATDRQLATEIERLRSGVPFLLPKTGVLSRQYDLADNMFSPEVNTSYAPLEIKAESGSNYFVKVVRWESKDEALAVFIRGGETINTSLPVGSYEIRYAFGQDWYGIILDFGPEAFYSRYDNRFDFKKTFDGHSGFTIKLIQQVNGNLETDPISADDF